VINKALDGYGDDAPAEETAAEARARDEKGRFAAKQEQEAAAAPEGTSAEPPQVASTEQPAQTAQPDASEGQFRGWSPEQRAAFGQLPPEAQKTVIDVVKGRDSFYSEKMTEFDNALKAASPYVTAVQPHFDRISQVTRDPAAYVSHVLDIDRRLQFAPFQEKAQLLSELAQNIGVPISIQQTDPFADPLSISGEAYPVIHDLKNQVNQLQAQVQSYQRNTETAQRQQVDSQVRSFQSQTNADGTPKHPHFDVVKGTMGQLLDRGEARSLEEAYAIAVKPIEAAIQNQIAATTRATQAASQAALEKAKRAMPVKRTGMVPGGKTKGGGLDAIIGGALDRAGFN
jgi:gamma-glutamylcysteine synthetase